MTKDIINKYSFARLVAVLPSNIIEMGVVGDALAMECSDGKYYVIKKEDLFKEKE